MCPCITAELEIWRWQFFISSHIFHLALIHLYEDTYVQSNFATMLFCFWIKKHFPLQDDQFFQALLSLKNNLFHVSSACVLSSFSTLLCFFISISPIFFSFASFSSLIALVNYFYQYTIIIYYYSPIGHQQHSKSVIPPFIFLLLVTSGGMASLHLCPATVNHNLQVLSVWGEILSVFMRRKAFCLNLRTLRT